MLPISPRGYPPQARTLADEEGLQTSIRVQPSPPEINLESIAQEAHAAGLNDYSNRLSKERYGSARASLPTGNYDWTDFRARQKGKKQRQRREWTLQQRLLLGLLILLLVAGIVFLAIYLLAPADKSLHEESVQPIVPTFNQMSGKITASKLQPLVPVDDKEGEIGSRRHMLEAD